MDLLSREEVLKIARKVVDDQETTLVDYELCNESEESRGYLGNHLTLKLELSKDENSKRQMKRLFVKTYEAGPRGEDFLGSTGIFLREQDFYRIVLEDVAKYVEESDWCPKHHFSKERVLILEDLSERGFKMVEDKQKRWALDRDHMESALKTLSAMHATSIILEEKRNDRLPSLYPQIFAREILYDENKLETPTRMWIKRQIKDLLEGVNHLDKYSPMEKIIIRERFENQIMRIYPLSKISQKYKNVITHGDMWRNNLLFRYSDQNLPFECRFVDFQFVRYSAPAHDVTHLLHFTMKKETRDRMESHLLGLYYENLSKRLKRFGVDAEKVIKEDEFFTSYKEYKELALIQCLLSLHYILGSASLSVETGTPEQYDEYLSKNRKRYMDDFFNQSGYVDKIKDLFEELIDSYILKERTNGGI